MFYGAILFKLFGVSIKWVIFNIYNFLGKRESVSFKALWNNDVPGKNDSFGQFSGEFGDILIGAGIILIICYLSFAV
ncbi:hypothetical protein BY457_1185 [Marinilabilia salmonicolor]|jgi:hypothetical protein|uniref:hypothetical protein n=1 Tax=Marinilabilia salmonicolor TaxID=989 RepID=UPI000D054835|nr:hypothetical protein [Marinilabilia salmonicolor]PRY95864.1 hypothetical protein BY457_1185 [Marinilabilia salmonicolor]